jgi:LPXTG-motif cell wall-anchored protein
MKKLTSFGAVGFAALIAALAMVGFQSPAQAYPEASIDLRVDHQTVYSGESFTATASSDVRCEWVLEWDHQKRRAASSSGHDFVTSFRARHVKTTTHVPLHGTCTYDAGDTSNAQPSTWERTIDITVEPKSAQVSPPGHDDHGHGAQVAGPQAAGAHTGVAGSDLPATGGPNRLFLVGGLVLVISGATAVTIARRRAEEAELRASRV